MAPDFYMPYNGIKLIYAHSAETGLWYYSKKELVPQKYHYLGK